MTSESNQTAADLLEKIRSHRALVGIIGLGYVGLPLALAFVEKGFRVLGFDVDREKVEKLSRGECYIKHLDGGRVAAAKASGLLSCTTDFLRLAEPDAVLICVPTPLTPQREPDMTYVVNSARQVKSCLRPGQLVVLESTTYPGTTDELLKGILEAQSEPSCHPEQGHAAARRSDERETGLGVADPSSWMEGLPTRSPLPGGEGQGEGAARRHGRSSGPHPDSLPKGEGASPRRVSWKGAASAASEGSRHAGRPPLRCGRDFFLAFSPEREDPGNKNYGTTNTPKVVGGVDDVSGDLAQALYDQVVARTVRVSSARAAEATKLMENIFRAVNIALVNELKIVYDRMGIDVWEVLDAAETKPFGFMRFNPGPGWGGHCIPLDPFYLSWKAKEYGVAPKFIELAGDVNVTMPEYVVGKLQHALNERGKAVKGSRILILGIAYKQNIDDPRESPAFEIIEHLLRLGAEVSYHDPHIPVAPRMRTWPDLPPMRSRELTAESLGGVDAVIIVTDHRAVDYELVARHAPLVVVTPGLRQSRAGRR